MGQRFESSRATLLAVVLTRRLRYKSPGIVRETSGSCSKEIHREVGRPDCAQSNEYREIRGEVGFLGATGWLRGATLAQQARSGGRVLFQQWRGIAMVLRR
jgi:hypothetical protein